MGGICRCANNARPQKRKREREGGRAWLLCPLNQSTVNHLKENNIKLVMMAKLVFSSLVMAVAAIEEKTHPCGCVDAAIGGGGSGHISLATAWTLLQVQTNLAIYEYFITKLSTVGNSL